MLESLTGSDNLFEDFPPGLVIRHARGKTIEAFEHVLITNMTMNTAQGHFNEHWARTTRFGQRMVFGGYTMALVLGLASQDTGENAVGELALDKIKLGHPVFAGDTLYAYSEVLAVHDGDRPDAGIVHFRHWGVNQDDTVVFEGERQVLIRRRHAR